MRRALGDSVASGTPSAHWAASTHANSAVARPHLNRLRIRALPVQRSQHTWPTDEKKGAARAAGTAAVVLAIATDARERSAGRGPRRGRSRMNVEPGTSRVWARGPGLLEAPRLRGAAAAGPPQHITWVGGLKQTNTPHHVGGWLSQTAGGPGDTLALYWAHAGIVSHGWDHDSLARQALLPSIGRAVVSFGNYRGVSKSAVLNNKLVQASDRRTRRTLRIDAQDWFSRSLTPSTSALVDHGRGPSRGC